MHHRWLVLILALGAFLAGGVDSSWGETPEAAAKRHYGAGVHAYHQGNYDKAVRELDLASGLAPDDARIFLIRGAAKMRLGRVDDAKSDFHYGASVELASRQRDVGVALERIQGADRLVLESYRRQARAAATASQEVLRAHEKAVAEAKSAEAAGAKAPGDKPKAEPPTTDKPTANPAPKKPAAAKPDDSKTSDFDDPFGSEADAAETDEPVADEPAEEEAVEDEASEEAPEEETSAESIDDADNDDDDDDALPRPTPAPPRVSSFRINNLPPDASDPFANDAQNTLGRGAIEEAAEPKGLADDSTSGDSTDGDAATSAASPAGAALGGGTSRGKPGDDGDEPLEGFDAPAGDASKRSGSGAVGAAFRALMRSVVPPGVSLDKLPTIGPGGAAPSGMPGGMPSGGFEATDGDDEPQAAEGTADPFDVPAAPAEEEPSKAESGDAFEEEDPFSTDAPEDAGDAPTEESTDEATEEADDDPFGS